MIYEVSEIQQAVRVVMDKNAISPILGGVIDIDTIGVDDIIRKSIPVAVRNVHTVAPFHLLELGHDMGDELYWNGDGSGWLLLPDDFMRFVVFQMSDWERAVYDALTPDDAEYALQRSRWKGVRGTPQKPVCAVCVRPEGKVLEFYSCKDEDAFVTRGVYIPLPKVSEDGGIEISEPCYAAVVYECAALTFASLGDVTQETLMRTEARSLLGLATTNQQQ